LNTNFGIKNGQDYKTGTVLLDYGEWGTCGMGRVKVREYD
jgi:hypothetical protein